MSDSTRRGFLRRGSGEVGSGPSRPSGVAGVTGRITSSPGALAAVVLGVFVARLVAGMLIPAVRGPGPLDVVVFVLAVAVAAYLVVRSRPNRVRMAAAVAAAVFWVNPWVSGIVHGQDASPAALAMAAVAVVLILAPPRAFAACVVAISAGALVCAVSLLFGGLTALGVLDGAFHSVGEYARTTAGIPALKGIALHPNTLGSVAAATLLLSMLFTLDRRRPGTWIIPAVATFALLWSQSRSALLGVGAVLVVLILLRRSVTVRPYVVGVALLAPLSPFILGAPLVRLLSLEGVTNAVFNGRPVAWGAGFFGFIRDPVIGYGPDAFTKSFWKGAEVYWQPLHAHNEVIETLAQSGLVGFAALLGLALTAVVAVLLRPWPAALPATLLFALTAFVAAVEVPLGLSYFPVSYLFPAMVVAGMAHLRSPRAPVAGGELAR